ncbi:hypothetical protein BH10BAC1_BH10BAC1_16860 [soil metagenome]
MQKIIGLFFIVFIVAAGSVSCKKEKDPPIDIGYNYFPDQVGKYVVYDVDSFYYDNFNVPTTIDTFKFQIKEKIQSTYLDNQNRTTLRLERYIRYYSSTVPYSALPWTLRDVWAENRTATTAEKVEENVRFIKLAFAVKQGQTWDGNAQNTLGSQTYSYQFFDLPKTIAGISFDSVLQVNQLNNQSLISKQYAIEKYAKRTGLIYKQVIDVSSQPNPNWSNSTLFPFGNDSLAAFYAKPILQRVTSGIQYSYIYNASGTE